MPEKQIEIVGPAGRRVIDNTERERAFWHKKGHCCSDGTPLVGDKPAFDPEAFNKKAMEEHQEKLKLRGKFEVKDAAEGPAEEAASTEAAATEEPAG